MEPMQWIIYIVLFLFLIKIFKIVWGVLRTIFRFFGNIVMGITNIVIRFLNWRDRRREQKKERARDYTKYTYEYKEPEREREREKTYYKERRSEEPKHNPYETTKERYEKLFGLKHHSYTIRELKRIYHELCLKNHPDVGGDSDKFIEIKIGYDYLIQVFGG